MYFKVIYQLIIWNLYFILYILCIQYQAIIKITYIFINFYKFKIIINGVNFYYLS